jgi:signal transduction histidine kinase
VSGAPGPAAAETLPFDLHGGERWLSISGVGFDDGTVYAFRDLTEERALEQMRQDLVATVSHEVRTPLAAIYGSALTLTRDDLELEATMHSKLLEVIVEESARLADIVNDLLLASQLDAGKLVVRIERCDAGRLVDSVVEAARTHLPDNVTIEVETAPEDVPTVAADEGQLRQVLDNLLDNAIRYSPEGGDVRVKLERAGNYVRFAISDQGLGIPPSEQSRIFEKFFRLDPHMSRGIGGTGLGLYICRELVRRMEGKIWVESQVGEGSTFVVELPAAAERRARA